jgi:hypothetical protein
MYRQGTYKWKQKGHKPYVGEVDNVLEEEKFWRFQTNW